MAGPGLADACQQVRVAIALADRLELSDALRASRRLIARSEELGQVVREEQARARERRAKELQRLVTGTTKPAIPVVLATLGETLPWLDTAEGRAGPAISLVMEAARVCHGHAHAAAVAEVDDRG